MTGGGGVRERRQVCSKDSGLLDLAGLLDFLWLLCIHPAWASECCRCACMLACVSPVPGAVHCRPISSLAGLEVCQPWPGGVLEQAAAPSAQRHLSVCPWFRVSRGFSPWGAGKGG